MNTPLVSIIIPIYNVAAYLDKCIETMVHQTYSKIEIILVDDGSQDSCPQICDEWSLKDDRIKVIHKKNGGPSEARNVGIDIAKGEYVYFLDGDDYVESHLIEEVLPYMEDGADMVVFGHFENYQDGKEKEIRRPNKTYYIDTIEQKANFIVGDFLGYKLGWEPWNRIFRRSIIEEYAIRFAEHRQVFSEDLFFCLCYCAHIKQIVSLPKQLYHYVQRSESTMGKKGKNIIINEMNELGKLVLQHYMKHLDSRGLVEYFPTIHYLIVNNVFQHVIRCKSCSITELRYRVYNEIQDQSFFWTNAQLFIRKKNYLLKIKGVRLTAEYISFCQYLFDGSYTRLRIRNRCMGIITKYFL